MKVSNDNDNDNDDDNDDYNDDDDQSLIVINFDEHCTCFTLSDPLISRLEKPSEMPVTVTKLGQNEAQR